MPRPKGSKNKSSEAAFAAQNLSSEMIAGKIAAIASSINDIEAEIEDLTAELKEKKADLKSLKAAREAAEKQLEIRKAEEDKARLINAISTSGKSMEEIMAFLNQ